MQFLMRRVSFAPGSEFGQGTTRSIAAGDLDADGDPDLVTAEFQVVRLWANDGTGKFSAAGEVVSGSDCRAVLVVDIDGDGDKDIVVGNGSQQPNRIYVNSVAP